MHIIQDIEAFFKDLDDTVYAWFGVVRSGEEFKKELELALTKHITPILSGAIEPVIEAFATPEVTAPDEQPDASIEPISPTKKGK